MTWWMYLLHVALVAIPTISVLMVALDWSLLRIRSAPLGVAVGAGGVVTATLTATVLAAALQAAT